MTDKNTELHDLYEKVLYLKHLQRMLDYLNEKKTKFESEIRDLQISNDKEQADVKRLEGNTFAAFFYDVIGKFDERLTIERIQALAAQAKLESAEEGLEETCSKICEIEAKLQILHGCEDQYTAILEDKKTTVMKSDNPNALEILELEGKIVAAGNQIKEICEATDAGDFAIDAAEKVLDELKRAEKWGTFQLAGGGIPLGIMANSHIKKAQKLLWDMRKCFNNFCTEISDVDIQLNPSIWVDDITVSTFFNLTDLFDIFFTDYYPEIYVIDQITKSESQVKHTIEQVKQAMKSLLERKQTLESEIEKLNDKINEIAFFFEE